MGILFKRSIMFAIEAAVCALFIFAASGKILEASRKCATSQKARLIKGLQGEKPELAHFLATGGFDYLQLENRYRYSQF